MATATRQEIRNWFAAVEDNEIELDPVGPVSCIPGPREYPPCMVCKRLVGGDPAVVIDQNANTVTFHPCGCVVDVRGGHPFQQAPKTIDRVCVCGKRPDHYDHTGEVGP